MKKINIRRILIASVLIFSWFLSGCGIEDGQNTNSEEREKKGDSLPTQAQSSKISSKPLSPRKIVASSDLKNPNMVQPLFSTAQVKSEDKPPLVKVNKTQSSKATLSSAQSNGVSKVTTPEMGVVTLYPQKAIDKEMANLPPTKNSLSSTGKSQPLKSVQGISPASAVATSTNVASVVSSSGSSELSSEPVSNGSDSLQMGMISISQGGKTYDGVLIYQLGDAVLVPIETMLADELGGKILENSANILSIQVTSDAAVTVNLANKTLQFGDNAPIRLNKSQYTVSGGIIYVDYKLLNNLYSLMSYNSEQQILTLQTKITPFKETLSQQSQVRKNFINKENSVSKVDIPEVPTQWFTLGKLQLQYATGLQNGIGFTSNTFQVSYINQMFKGIFQISGQTNPSYSLNNVSLTYNQLIPEQTLTFGDVNPNFNDMPTQQVLGVGLLNNNQVANSYGEITIQGYAPTGNIVELYCNQTLVAFQTAQNSQYLFENVKVVGSSAVFLVKVYDSYGNVTTRTIKAFGNSQLLNQGQTSYQGVAGVLSSDNSVSTAYFDGEYGIFKNLTLDYGYAHNYDENYLKGGFYYAGNLILPYSTSIITLNSMENNGSNQYITLSTQVGSLNIAGSSNITGISDANYTPGRNLVSSVGMPLFKYLNGNVVYSKNYSSTGVMSSSCTPSLSTYISGLYANTSYSTSWSGYGAAYQSAALSLALSPIANLSLSYGLNYPFSQYTAPTQSYGVAFTQQNFQISGNFSSNSQVGTSGTFALSYIFNSSFSLGSVATVAQVSNGKITNSGESFSFSKTFILDNLLQNDSSNSLNSDWMYGHVYQKDIDGTVTPVTSGSIESNKQIFNINSDGSYFVSNISSYPSAAKLDYSKITDSPEFAPVDTTDTFYVQPGQGVQKDLMVERVISLTGVVMVSNDSLLQECKLELYKNGAPFKQIDLEPIYEGNFMISGLPANAQYEFKLTYTGTKRVKLFNPDIKVDSSQGFFIVLPNMGVEEVDEKGKND